MTIIKEKTYETIEDAASKLADELSQILANALDERGHASLAVSGGRTPQYVFNKLNKLEMDWSKVTITLTDERWVPPDHAESNEGLVRSHLLQSYTQAAKFIPLYGGESSPQEGQSACASRLSELELPFDAVYLGMGEDGHFASLFPGDSAINIKNQSCVAIAGTKSRLPRMSLTAETVLNAKKIFLLFSGLEKKEKYTSAKSGGSPLDIPIRLVVNQNKIPVDVLSVI